MKPHGGAKRCFHRGLKLASVCHQLDAEVRSIVGLLEAILIENPPHICRELPAVLQVLMPLLQSPLASPHIRQVFLDIGVCLMPTHLQHLGTCTRHLGKDPSASHLFTCFYFFPAVLVGHVTLRLLKPACDLDEAWEQEDLDTAVLRTILLLHSHTVPQREAKSSGEHAPPTGCFWDCF